MKYNINKNILNRNLILRSHAEIDECKWEFGIDELHK